MKISDENFFFLVDKPKYISSFKSLSELKKIYSKVGHSGTLDPYAEGLLIVGVNRALKFLRFLPEKKEYIFDIKFGIETNSDDFDGDIIRIMDCKISRDAIIFELAKFIGEIAQVPSRFSALKVNGRRAYDLARNNIDFELKSRIVNIFAFDLINFDEQNNVARFKVECSKGTYVRSLARDLCKYLGIIGCVSYLRRVQSDGFCIDQKNEYISLDCMKKFYPILILLDEDIVKLKNGVRLLASYENDNVILAIVDKKETFSGLVLFTRGMLFPLSMI